MYVLFLYRRRVETEVRASSTGDRVYQEAAAARVWRQAGGGAAEQEAARKTSKAAFGC